MGKVVTLVICAARCELVAAGMISFLALFIIATTQTAEKGKYQETANRKKH
jgi:hypothetical protein